MAYKVTKRMKQLHQGWLETYKIREEIDEPFDALYKAEADWDKYYNLFIRNNKLSCPTCRGKLEPHFCTWFCCEAIEPYSWYCEHHGNFYLMGDQLMSDL